MYPEFDSRCGNQMRFIMKTVTSFNKEDTDWVSDSLQTDYRIIRIKDDNEEDYVDYCFQFYDGDGGLLNIFSSDQYC